MFGSIASRVTFNYIRDRVAGDLASKSIEAVCRNFCNFQRTYPSQQHDMASYDHRLRMEMDKKKPNPQNVLELTKKLIHKGDESLDKACYIASNALSEHFSLVGRGKVKPRVCVKSISKNIVFDLSRGDKEYRWRKFPYTENTGFMRVYEKPTEHYIENDIPKAAQEGRYINGRLNSEIINHYKPQSLWNKLISDDDSDWRLFWEDGKGKKNSQVVDYYKSTLIVAITAESGELSTKFKKRFQSEISDYKDYLFGFLCLDHVNCNYFQEQDANIAWFYADLVSIPFIMRSGYINYSANFRNAESFLGDKGLLGELYEKAHYDISAEFEYLSLLPPPSKKKAKGNKATT